MSIICLSSHAFSQCPNNNNPYGIISNLNPGQTSTVYCMYGGEYATISVAANSTYIFSTCGGSWDSQLTLYTTNGSYLAYNDDACGLQSEITWTATFTGQVRVMLDRYYCSSYYSCMNLNVTRQNNQPPANPCAAKETLSCDQTAAYNLASGTGTWNPPGPWGTPGNEQVYEFTATVSGVHQINMSHSSGGWVDLFIKSGSCNQNGWTYVDDIYSSATNYITLNAGQTYHFLVDDENTSSSAGSIQIICPNPAQDPCNSITSLTCGQTSSYSLEGGPGAWNPPGPWGTPGNEQVFEFTPATSGNYTVSLTHSSGYYVDLFYKSGSCGQNGWTYLDDIYSSSTNTVSLNGGTTYYFLIDDENTSASSGAISISCPCIGNMVDEVVNLSGNATLFNNTSGACNDCNLRPSEDITYEINIPCAGTYTFETCDLASWDTYLYLSSSPCSGVLASNDDNCGLRSRITYTFASAGTYYITVEGFSQYAGGSFGLNVSRSCDLSVNLSTSLYECGYEISCSGLDDGEITATASGCGALDYSWSNGATGANNSNLGSGTYTINVMDAWGCAATASATLSEPDPLVANAGNDQTVYYGYTPLSCADLSGSATGGCAEYSYSWSANGNVLNSNQDINVCPDQSTTYELEVVDQNGCSSTSSMNICVIDVVCYAGNSGNQKVEICHVPPGNPGNAHTICVNESAVADHLAHGCSLGSCDEQGDCPTNFNVQQEPSYAPGNSLQNLTVNVYPNPFQNLFTIQYAIEELRTLTFVVTDVMGRTIKSYTIEPLTYKGEVEIDLTDANQGTYLLSTYINEQKLYNPIIKK